MSLLAAGCSSQPRVCGESFCMPVGAKLISRETPVDDFNIYRVDYDGQRFLIYEGNAPARRPRSVVLETKQKRWPQFVEVNGPCANDRDCATRSFAAKISLR
jgi:hypothetical protein